MKHLLLLIVVAAFCHHARSQGCSTNYIEPSFQLTKTDPGCNPTSGSITVVNAQDGVAPYTFRLIEQNITNGTGVFTGLAAGSYSIEMKDACGTIRTRQVSLVPFSYSFTYTVQKNTTGCNEGTVTFTVSPAGTYSYGVFVAGRDTAWSNSPSMTVRLGREMFILVKDACGNIQSKKWTAPEGFVPYIKELQYRLQCDKVDIFPVYVGFTNPRVCLYSYPSKQLIECKSATGPYEGGSLTNFFDKPFGVEYYVIVEDACARDSMYFPDMTSMGGSQLDPYDWDCNVFKLHVDGPPPPKKWYDKHPEIDGSPDSICLYDLTRNKKVGCKPTDDHLNWINPRTGDPWPSGAVWANLPYGEYRAYIYDPCMDSTFKIDSLIAYPTNIKSNSSPNCTFNQSAVSVEFDPGTKSPYTVQVFYPDGTLATSKTSTQTFNYLTFAAYPAGGTLQVVAQDACGNKDTSTVVQESTRFTKSFVMTQKCPGVSGNSGSGDLQIDADISASYMQVIPKIIKKDGADVSIDYSAQSNLTQGKRFSFVNLPTGRYVVRYSFTPCTSNEVFDTVEVKDYFYPEQIAPHIIQCGDNPYVFRDSTINGISPFTFEIISTQALMPQLLTGPQTSNLFRIPPGTSLDSIKIRVVDACGNSSIKNFPVQKLTTCQPLDVKDDPRFPRLEDKVIQVYPNPSTGSFTVAISKKKKANYRIEVINASGVRLFEKSLFNVDRINQPVNITAPPGLYIVNVRDLTTGQLSVFKEIIQR